MAKPDQVKFYAPGGLISECKDVFESQGVTLSEGMVRLMKLLTQAPEDMWPVLLGQARGNAARAVAKDLLRRKTVVAKRGPAIDEVAVDENGAALPPAPDEGQDSAGKRRRGK